MTYAPFYYVFVYTAMHCQQILKKPFFMSDCMKMTEISLVSCVQYNLRTLKVPFILFVLHLFPLAQPALTCHHRSTLTQVLVVCF